MGSWRQSLCCGGGGGGGLEEEEVVVVVWCGGVVYTHKHSTSGWARLASPVPRTHSYNQPGPAASLRTYSLPETAKTEQQHGLVTTSASLAVSQSRTGQPSQPDARSLQYREIDRNKLHS